MSTHLYVLLLQGGRYYIGKTQNLKHRIAEHMTGQGSAWTQKYKPLSVKETLSHVSPFQEESKTMEYMSKYGIDKVRGGSYSQVNLSKDQVDTLTAQFRSANDQCMRCGRTGHFIKDCYAKTDSRGNRLDDEDEDEDEDEDDTCFRCGRVGHYSSDCYATRDIHGRDIRRKK